VTRGLKAAALLLLLLPACAPDPLRESAGPSDEPPEYLPLEHLATLGVHAQRIDADHVLLYGSSPDDYPHAVCAAPLDCEAARCPRYEEAALAAPERCPGGDDGFERGVCGPFHWVASRRLLRYFDRKGALVARLSSDTSPSYCAGRAGTELAGRIPVCHHPVVSRHACGETSWATPEVVGELLLEMGISPGN
jgi:hypothetical protein